MNIINTQFKKAWKWKFTKIDVCYEEAGNKEHIKNEY